MGKDLTIQTVNFQTTLFEIFKTRAKEKCSELIVENIAKDSFKKLQKYVEAGASQKSATDRLVCVCVNSADFNTEKITQLYKKSCELYDKDTKSKLVFFDPNHLLTTAPTEYETYDEMDKVIEKAIPKVELPKQAARTTFRRAQRVVLASSPEKRRAPRVPLVSLPTP